MTGDLPVIVPMDSARLGLAAESLDDLEGTRIAIENRLRQRLIALGLLEPKKPGEDDTRDPVDQAVKSVEADDRKHADELKRTAALVLAVRKLERDATLALEAAVKAHPLGWWVDSVPGVGRKQGGRLLAALVDPYARLVVIRDAEGEATGSFFTPRRGPAQLWAYVGLHVLGGSDQQATDAQTVRVAAADPSHAARHTDRYRPDTQRSFVGVAARRRKGEKANWHRVAKSRVWLIAGSAIKHRCAACNLAAKARKAEGDNAWAPPPADCTCADTHPLRHEYDRGRAKYRDSIHHVPCERCGPSGHPAPVGTPLSDAHQHARAIRLVSKRILRDLWVAARDWHAAHGHAPHDLPAVGHGRHDAHSASVDSGQPFDPDQPSTSVRTTSIIQPSAADRGDLEPALAGA